MTESLQRLSLDKIEENPDNPRRRIDAAKLAEMTESVRANGVLQPILVRRVNGLFRVIAGSRRLKAAKMAGLREIPAIVTETDDEAAALNIALVENLQRENIHELDEATGYLALTQSGLGIADIATSCGKDESYVYKRMKLLNLIDPAREAFLNDEIHAGHALRIARLQQADQQKALEYCFTDRFGYAPMNEKQRKATISVKDLDDWIFRNIALRLEYAHFDTADGKLLADVPSCKKCPKRTGFDRRLFDDIDEKDMCTDPACFNDKAQAHVSKSLLAAERRGKPLVKLTSDYQVRGWKDGDPIPASRYQEIHEGESCSSMQMGIISQGRNLGRMFPVCINEACATHGKKASSTAADGDSWKEQQKKEEIARKRKRETRLRIVEAGLGSVKLPMSEKELQIVAFGLWSYLYHDAQKSISAKMGWKEKQKTGSYFGTDYDVMLRDHLKEMSMQDLFRFMVRVSLAREIDSHEGKDPDPVMDFAKLKGVDTKAIESEVKAEFRKKAKEARKKPSKKRKEPEAVGKDLAESTCEQCGIFDSEPRECGHVVCEDCYAGECPICAAEAEG